MTYHQDPARRPVEPTGRLDRAARTMTSVSHFLRAATSLLLRGGVLVLMVAGGAILLLRTGELLPSMKPAAPAIPPALTQVVDEPEPIPWQQVDAEVAAAAAAARQQAQQFADDELTAWTDELLVRIDEDFLPWYFSYWNQQAVGLKACWQGLKYRAAGYVTAGDTPSPAEQMTRDMQAEFASRVLRPQVAQLRIEGVTRRTVGLYLREMRHRLDKIQTRYRIPQQDWDRYLAGIAATVAQTSADRQVPLTLKAATATTAGAAAVLGRSLAKVAARIELRFAARGAEQAAGRLAAGAGSKVAARAGGKLLGPVLAAGVIVWDVWDHHRTVEQNRPLLREALVEYLALLRESLVKDSSTGVLAAIHEVEAGIVESLTHPVDAAMLARCEP